MVNLLYLFVLLAFFRASPSQVPAGRSTLQVAVLASVIINTAVTYTWYGLTVGLFLAVLEVVLSGSFLYVCLKMREHTARFEQSLASLAGAGAVMALCAWPWALEIGKHPEQPASWVVWGQMILLMWSLMIWSRVLRLAGELGAITSALLALGYLFFSALVFATLTPSLTQ